MWTKVVIKHQSSSSFKNSTANSMKMGDTLLGVLIYRSLSWVSTVTYLTESLALFYSAHFPFISFVGG